MDGNLGGRWEHVVHVEKTDTISIVGRWPRPKHTLHFVALERFLRDHRMS